jgi:hypothetical protein
MDLREIGWGGMDWIDLAEDRDQWSALVNTVMTNEPKDSITCWEILECLRNWRLIKKGSVP